VIKVNAFVLIGVVLALNSFANEPVAENARDRLEQIAESYYLGKEEIPFISVPLERLTISANCRVGGEWNCKAWEELQRLNGKKTKAVSHQGSSPGSYICEKAAHGKVVIVVDKDRNERSFCKFPDRSYVDIGTLWFYSK